MVTRADLIADGCVPNPNMWIGDGWFYCRACRVERKHEAYSHKGEADCYEVCKTCGTYSGRNAMRTQPVLVETR